MQDRIICSLIAARRADTYNDDVSPRGKSNGRSITSLRLTNETATNLMIHDTQLRQQKYGNSTGYCVAYFQKMKAHEIYTTQRLSDCVLKARLGKQKVGSTDGAQVHSAGAALFSRRFSKMHVKITVNAERPRTVLSIWKCIAYALWQSHLR